MWADSLLQFVDWLFHFKLTPALFPCPLSWQGSLWGECPSVKWVQNEIKDYLCLQSWLHNLLDSFQHYLGGLFVQIVDFVVVSLHLHESVTKQRWWRSKIKETDPGGIRLSMPTSMSNRHFDVSMIESETSKQVSTRESTGCQGLVTDLNWWQQRERMLTVIESWFCEQVEAWSSSWVFCKMIVQVQLPLPRESSWTPHGKLKLNLKSHFLREIRRACIRPLKELEGVAFGRLSQKVSFPPLSLP